MDDASTTLDRLIAQTPASRVRAVDGARALAILAVVVGHWLAAAVVAVNGDIGGVNVLGEADWTHPFTWVFQVMAVIFLAGGFASAASWSSWRERGGAWGGWASQRAARLLQPTLAFVGVGAGALALGRLFGFPADLAHDAGWLVAIALWFLGVYVVTTVATPALVALFERHRWWALGAMVGVVALGDAAHLTTGEQAYAWANFIIAWLVFQYVGVAWHAGGLPTRLARLLAAGALGAAALAALGPYPLSMVNVPGAEVQNASPPTFALVAHGVGLAALAVVAAPALERALRRRRLWGATIAVNAYAMTIYLWHFVPVVLAALVLLGTGLFPQPPILSGEWLAWRPAWLVVLAALLVPLVAAFGRVERSRVPADPAERVPAWRPAVAVAVAAPTIIAITRGGLQGFGPLGLPVVEIAALSLAVALTWRRRPASAPVPAPPPPRRRPMRRGKAETTR